MAKFYIPTMSIYAIKQCSVCGHGNKNDCGHGNKMFASSVSLTASINQISALRL